MKTLILLNPIGTNTFQVIHVNRPNLTIGHIYLEVDGSHVFEPVDHLPASLPAYVLHGIANEMDKLDAGWLAQLETTTPPTAGATANAA